MNHTTVVHYPGAGWDDSFLHVPEFQQVDRFVLYDMLPYQTHYCHCHPATIKSDTPEHFFATLDEVFGPPSQVTRRHRVYHHQGRRIDYYCYHNCWHMVVKRNDVVYLRGMNPHVLLSPQTFVSCDSNVPDGLTNYDKVHVSRRFGRWSGRSCWCGKRRVKM